MGDFTTKGHRMNDGLRQRVIDALASREGATMKDIAARLGITRHTLRDYMTREVLNAVDDLREAMKQPGIEMVDRAMLVQACKGNVAAARLVYLRMAQKGQGPRLPTLDEMEAELRALRARELRNKETTDGETSGDAAAVVDGENR